MLPRRWLRILLLLALLLSGSALVLAAPSEPVGFPSALLLQPWRDPEVVPRFLPYARWEAEYRRYFLRHAHDDRIDLQPQILVMHYTATRTFHDAWKIFARGCRMSAGRGVVFGHPSVHFMIDRDGTIYQLMPTWRRATGTYGVNHVALQVEMVARNERDLLRNPRLIRSALRLAKSLVERFHIPPDKVYGHMDVSRGRSVVPEYLDHADPVYPDRYPPRCARVDPGRRFMAWLNHYLRVSAPIALPPVDGGL